VKKQPDDFRLADEPEPVAWQVWVGADTPLNAPMGWHFYNTYDSLKSAEATARSINAAKAAPFAKIVSLYTIDKVREQYERGFIDGMQKQMKSSVDRAVNAMGKKEWVGLTDEEKRQILLDDPIDWINTIEAKLKEKNT
jgi:hypothetical protein